jgi:hypothetical protein
VALITGVTFVAYKRPRSYRKFYDPLWITVSAVLVGRLIYNIGFGNGFIFALSAFHDLNKGVLISSPRYPSTSFLASFVLPILILLWLLLLLYLPSILDLEKDETKS